MLFIDDPFLLDNHHLNQQSHLRHDATKTEHLTSMIIQVQYQDGNLMLQVTRTMLSLLYLSPDVTQRYSSTRTIKETLHLSILLPT